MNDIILLLTSCGLLCLHYDKNKNEILPICREVLNLDSEYRDKFMYLEIGRCIDDFIITIYSNNNTLFVYQFNAITNSFNHLNKNKCKFPGKIIHAFVEAQEKTHNFKINILTK